jgi:hypothetical protein
MNWQWLTYGIDDRGIAFDSRKEARGLFVCFLHSIHTKAETHQVSYLVGFEDTPAVKSGRGVTTHVHLVPKLRSFFTTPQQFMGFSLIKRWNKFTLTLPLNVCNSVALVTWGPLFKWMN